MDKIVAGVMLYLLVCVLAVLCGLGILRLFKLNVTAGSLLLAPVITLVFWSLGLGITGGVRLPIKEVALWLWGATIVLAIYGLPRFRAHARAVPLLLLCIGLPILTMGRYFLNGLTDYLGSVLPDGWSYIAFGQYLWEYPRGAEGGLAPLYQYAAHLSQTRFVSAALLAFFSPLVRAGDTQASSSLLQAWGLFSTSCAVALFWLITQKTTRIVIVATVLSVVAGWMINLVWANNLDNELALVYMPASAGMLRLLNAEDWRWWLALGGLLAGITYTYPELALFILIGTLLIALPRFWQERTKWRTWLKGVGLMVVVAAVLLVPIQSILITFVQTQFAVTVSGGARPGEGLFGGLAARQFQPAALWGLGGEHRLESYKDFRNILGAAFSLFTGIGLIVLARQRQWGLVAVTLLLTLGVLYYIVIQHYSYAAYKLLTIAWWCLVAALTFGIDWVLTRLHSRFSHAVAPGLIVLLGVVAINMFATDRYLGNQTISVAQFRQVNLIKDMVGASPMRVRVDDWIANEWAVYYLRDNPILLDPYRMYMAQAHVVPFMQRATPVDPNTIRYVLTDLDLEQEARDQGWQKKWSGGPYILWQTE